MIPLPNEVESSNSQVRLFLEEMCCDLCRFDHVDAEGVAPEQVKVDRDVCLGLPGAFADIRVAPPRGPHYFVEVDVGYSDAALLRSLRRKYTQCTPAIQGAAKLVLVIDTERHPNWPALEADLARTLAGGLKLEVWSLQMLLDKLRSRFSVNITSITEQNLVDLRSTINHAKGFQAFGGKSQADYAMDGLHASLLWHFGFWRLRQLREEHQLLPRDIMPPRIYRGVAILLVDLCSFSSYVRDTPDDSVVRHCLTSFYSKARYQIINHGGMLSQFIGDEAVGLFGIPDQRPGYVQQALDAARALIDIGNAVSGHWQRSIDRVQKSGGVHIGIALGDLQVVSLQPFGRAQMGVIGDPINMAARLMASAGPNEIVVSNAYLRELDEDIAGDFKEIEPLDAHNIGKIRAWKLTLNPGSP